MSDADLQDAAGGPRLGSEDPGGRSNSGTGIPLVVAVGIGGRIELTAEQVMLIKGGVFGHAVELLWLGYGIIEKSIPVRTISAVEIVTTDEGPMTEDVFWVLHGPQSSLSIPQTADGTDDLLERLQRLPGFDNEALITALARVSQVIVLRRSLTAMPASRSPLFRRPVTGV